MVYVFLLLVSLFFLSMLEGASRAVKYLLSAIGYDGSKHFDRVGELPLVPIEIEPEDVQWLKV